MKTALKRKSGQAMVEYIIIVAVVAIAALDQQLRRLGYNMADEFNQRLLSHMGGK